ncbi:MAG: hypothetical protein KJO77_11820, partial [Bacteroidia bacterium]|nr:hypothetical protein [Bacteroidia bacterium]
SYAMRDIEEAKNQIAVFKDPRADYISQEAKAMATMVEAQILASTDQKAAVALLKKLDADLNISGAQMIKAKISNLMDQIIDSNM